MTSIRKSSVPRSVGMDDRQAGNHDARQFRMRTEEAGRTSPPLFRFSQIEPCSYVSICLDGVKTTWAIQSWANCRRFVSYTLVNTGVEQSARKTGTAKTDIGWLWKSVSMLDQSLLRRTARMGTEKRAVFSQADLQEWSQGYSDARHIFPIRRLRLASLPRSSGR